MTDYLRGDVLFYVMRAETCTQAQMDAHARNKRVSWAWLRETTRVFQDGVWLAPYHGAAQEFVTQESEMTDNDRVDAVVAGMRRFRSHATSQTVGCRAMRAFAFRADEGISSHAGEVGGIAQTIAAMKTHPHDRDVQAHGVSTLAAFCERHAQLVMAAGGVRLAVTAMRAQQSCPTLQVHGMELIMLVCEHNVGLVESGFVDHAACAMQTHGGDASVVRTVLRMLEHTVRAGAADVRPPVVAAGAIALTVAAMTRHPAELLLQRNAVTLMWALVNGPDLAANDVMVARILDEGGLAVVETAFLHEHSRCTYTASLVLATMRGTPASWFWR